MLHNKIFAILVIVVMVAGLAGCSVVLQKRHPSDQERIEELEDIARSKDKQAQDLLSAKKQLEMRLKKEIEENQLHLDMAERGLVITFVAEVLFDSGKAELKQDSKKALDEVASVLNKEVLDRDVSIEGHTDNAPIKHSGWKSNWELSTGRAVSVLHYLVDEKNISPQRVSATGYGEQRPIAANDTKENMKKNRRVEIVILPKKVVRVKEGEEAATQPKYKK